MELSHYRRERGTINIHATYLNFDGDISVGAGGNVGVVYQAAPDTTSKDIRARIKSLNPVSVAEWNAGNDWISGCLEGTREDLLIDLIRWYQNPDAPSFYWLTGGPGTGKSAVSVTACEKFSELQVLVASFFISRDRESCNKMDRVFATIAHRLSLLSPQLESRIYEALRDTTLLGSVPQKQLRELVIAPIRQASDSFASPILLVIDALDECEGDNKERVSKLVDLLITEVTQPMTKIKVLLTSRREDHLLRILNREATKVQSRDIEDFIPITDIELYVKSKMLSLEKEFRVRWTPGCEWPADAHFQAVIAMCGSLFLSAFTILRILESQSMIKDVEPDPRRTLKTLMEDTQPVGAQVTTVNLDELYLEILKLAARCHPTSRARTQLRLLLALVVLAVDRLSVEEINSLLKFDSRVYFPVLRAVLEVPEGEGPVRTLHASFHDFIIDPHRCINVDVQFIDPTHYHATFAGACLEELRNLKRNALHISSPSQTNKDISGHSISQAFNKEMCYAVKSWAMHVAACASGGVIQDEELIVKVTQFVYSGLLHWIEALSYLDHLAQARVAVEKVVKLLMMGNHQSLRILLRDTCRFIQSSFAVIARAAMHTYIFALPFTPFETDLYRRYVDTSGPHAVRVIRGEEADWDPCVQVVKFSNPIKSVAVSGDGIHVAVACGKSIYLLDASTRVLIVTLEGHVEDVESIVFSTDSTRVASSAGDATIRIWNCLTGQQLQSLPGAKKRPYVVSKLDGSLLVVYRYSSAVFYDWLTGEAQEVLDKGDDVCSIAISSDGSRVAVASQHSVMTWTPKVKKRVLVKYDRPEEASVVFSSDADCLVSGYGPFIKFWDVDTGRLQKTFKMENGREVRLLAYSSDGRSLASVSSTGVVDIWDPTRGTITRTFKHDCWLMSVAFSANDAFLFSHNNAGALVTWDCGSTSQPNLESVPHNGPIEFMAISGDGATAISTADGTAIAWHTQSGKQLFKLVGHTYNTKAIAISQDGAYIVTGGDKKLRLWDKTGLELKVMKKKNMGSITAVAFLPNSHRVISGHEDECLIIWECRSGAKVKTLRLEKESGAITCIKFLNNGARMMTHSGGSGLTWLWNSSTWKQLYQLEYRGDPALDISLDGSLIAWATENFLRVYDSNTGNERFATPLGVTINGRLRPVQRIAFVHDCRFVVTQFEQGITLVWNAVTGERMSPPNPSLYPVAGRQKILKSTSRCCILSEGWFYEVDTDGQCIPICCLPTSMTVTSTCFHEDTCIIGTRSGGVVIICLPQYSEEAEL